MAAFHTMTAIKKKMHGMKTMKDSVFDEVDQLDQKLLEQKAIFEKVFFVSLSFAPHVCVFVCVCSDVCMDNSFINTIMR